MKQIPLNQGKFALVDDEDFEYLNQWKWTLHKCKGTSYARRIEYIDGVGKIIYMHRFILHLTDRKILCDHADQNGLNNQKFNLRTATKSQNNRNRTTRKTKKYTKYLGVYWLPDREKWKAQLSLNGKSIFLGYHENPESAALAYNQRAFKIAGEFAKLNIIKVS